MTASERFVNKPCPVDMTKLMTAYITSGGTVQVVQTKAAKRLCFGFSNTMSFKGHRRVPTTGRY